MLARHVRVSLEVAPGRLLVSLPVHLAGPLSVTHTMSRSAFAQAGVHACPWAKRRKKGQCAYAAWLGALSGYQNINIKRE